MNPNSTDSRPPLTCAQALRQLAADALERRRLAAEEKKPQPGDCGHTTNTQRTVDAAPQ